MKQILLANADILPRLWPHVEPLFATNKELWNKLFTLKDIYEWVYDGRLQLWCSNDEYEFNGAVLSCFVDYPQGRSLCLMWSNIDDLDESMKFLDFVEIWAKKNKAHEVLILGRIGWLKKLKSKGYVFDHQVISKNICNLKECN